MKNNGKDVEKTEIVQNNPQVVQITNLKEFDF